MPTQEPRDPFVDKFFERISPAIATSFTGPQLAAIKMAFGGRAWGSHPIDIRFSMPFLWRRYYVVFIAGRERRTVERRRTDRQRHPVATLGNAIVTTMFFLVMLLPLLLALYAVKATLEFGGPSGGGGSGLLQELADQLDQLFK